MQDAMSSRYLYVATRHSEEAAVIRKSEQSEVSENLCAINGHNWPIAGLFGKPDPTIREEARLNKKATREFFSLVGESVRYYHQKGIQKCEIPGCTATRKVFREIMIGSIIDGKAGSWRELPLDREEEIDSDPPRGENSFPEYKSCCEIFAATEASSRGN